jgi:hypothetical protein
MKKEVKTFYFFVKLSVKDEPVTPATRFKYFLVAAMGNEHNYRDEREAYNKIYKIAALLSKQDNTTYKVAEVKQITPDASNVLEEHFPLYDYKGDTLVLINQPFERILSAIDAPDDMEE